MQNEIDTISTPENLAQRIIDHFKPKGRVLDPCRGNGSFFNRLQTEEKDWCEIEQGKNFFSYRALVDYIISCPPWSIFRVFLAHSMEIADNICYLVPANVFFQKGIVSDISKQGFGIKEILTIESPATFPMADSELLVVHIQKGWEGTTKITEEEYMVQGELF